MKRNIKINYSVIEEVIDKITVYQGALETIDSAMKRIRKEVQNSKGEAIEELLNNYDQMEDDIGNCQNQLQDISNILQHYIRDMSQYSYPMLRIGMMRVDRNDIWFKTQNIVGALDIVGVVWKNQKYRGSRSKEEEEIKKEEANAREMEALTRQVETFKRKYRDACEELKSIHKNVVIPFDKTDNDYKRKASDLYKKNTNRGNRFADFFSWLGGKSADLVMGVFTGFTNLFVGLAKLLVGVVQYFGSGLVVFVCLLPIFGTPKWAESIFNNGNQMIKTILSDPSSVIKGILNHYYEIVEEEGIVFAFGYIGGTIAGIKFKAGMLGKVSNSASIKAALVKKTGLTKDQLSDVMKILKMDEAELTKVLKDKSLESLLGIDKMNMIYLKQQTGKSIEEITRILKEKGINIEDINGSNITDVLDKLKGAVVSKADRIKLDNWNYKPSDELYLKYKDVYDNPKYFNQVTGDPIYPETNGFTNGKYTIETMQPGTIIDRYGSNGNGQYFSPVGTSYGERALPPFMETQPYTQYEILKPFDVQSGTVAPWFDQLGKGTQFFTGEIMIKDLDGNFLPATVENLLDNKYIKLIR